MLETVGNKISCRNQFAPKMADEMQTMILNRVFEVTDRRNLDKQIRDNVKQFAHVAGVFEAITEGSIQLREALESGKKIVTTTVHKFPFIVDEMGDLPDRQDRP